MSSSEYDDHPPDTRPKAQRLMDRLWGLCELKGWKHDETATAGREFCFWPWGVRKPKVRAVPAVITEQGPGGTRVLPFVLLSTQAVVPEHFLRRHLGVALAECARFGVSLTASGLVTTPGPPWPVRAVNLTLSVPERALQVGGVDDALLLLDMLRSELARRWQALDGSAAGRGEAGREIGGEWLVSG